MASRTARLAAALVDGVLVFSIMFLGPAVALMVAAPSEGPPYADPQFVGVLTLTMWSSFLALSVLQWVLISKTSQSIGKRAVGIQILRTSGDRVGFLDGVVLRNWPWTWAKVLAGAVFSQAPLLGPFAAPLGNFCVTLMDVLPVFGPHRRCVRDYLAGTIVTVRTSEERPG